MIWLILALGLILRLINLDQSLWLDEASQMIHSSETFNQIYFGRISDFHPPLSYLIFHFWLLISDSVIWARLLSVLFGVGSIYGLYQFSKTLFNKNITYVSAALLAISPYHIYYSQEIRMYSMATFFAVFSMYFFIKLFNHKRWPIYLAGYVLATSALIWSLYVGVLLLLIQLIVVLIFQRKFIKRFLIGLTLVILPALIWIPQLMIQLKNGIKANEYLPGWGSILSLDIWKSIPLTLFKFSMGRVDFENILLYGILIIIVLIVMITPLILAIKNYQDYKTGLLIIWFFVPLIIAILVSIYIPVNQPFRLLFILPAYYLLIATGLDKLKWGRYVLLLIVTICFSGLVLYYFQPKFQREDWWSAANYLRERINYSAVVFIWPAPFDPYLWYLGDKNSFAVADKLPIDQGQLDQKLPAVIGFRDIYLFDYLTDLTDPNQLANKWLANHSYNMVETLDFTGVGFIYHYQKEI